MFGVMASLFRSIWPSHIVPTEVAKVLVLAGITCSATLDHCDIIPTEFPGWVVVLLDETIIQLGEGGDADSRGGWYSPRKKGSGQACVQKLCSKPTPE